MKFTEAIDLLNKGKFIRCTEKHTFLSNWFKIEKDVFVGADGYTFYDFEDLSPSDIKSLKWEARDEV